MVNTSKMHTTFSGTDSLVFIVLPLCTPIILGSISTISYSIFRDKKPVPLLGKINVGGFTRGTRVIAGTMIFTLINQHWVNDLVNEVPWLQAYGNLKADELPLFDIMIVSANEYGSHIQMFIYGIDVTDEGQVLSVENMFTENQFSFIARDIDIFNSKEFDTNIYKTNYTINRVDNLQLDIKEGLVNTKVYTGFNKILTYVPSNYMSGNDVKLLQEKLIANGYHDLNADGIFGITTYKFLMDFQSKNGLRVTGGTDDDTLKKLESDSVTTSISGVVISKEGTVVYEEPNVKSKIITTIPYKGDIMVLDNPLGWIKTDKGYILATNVYSTIQNSEESLGRSLRYQSTGTEVEKLQRLLNNIMPGATNELPITGVMDSQTVNRLKVYQSINGLRPDGVVNADTWLSLNEKDVNK